MSDRQTAFGFLFLFALFASFSSPTQQQDATYIYHICPSKTTYSKNSTYSSNLRNLLSTLSSANRFFTSGFYRTVYGQSPDEVFGLFLCRGDLSPEVCRDCVVFAINDTLNRCPEKKEGLIWYEECMLRYADQNVFLDSSLQNGTNGAILYKSTLDVFSARRIDRFRDLVLSTLNQSATEAALENFRKFDVRKASLNEFQTVYVLVQCLPDLPRQECLRCLQQIISQLQTDTTGGRLIMASCNSRYELYPFYNQSNIRAPQPQLDSAPPPTPGKAKDGKSSVVVIAVVLPITILFLLFVAIFSFRAKRKKTTIEMEPLAVDGDDITTAGSLQFDFKAIEAATDKFSESNKLGQGGFGEVYKGTFPSGVQVAVKRLSKTSGQGEREFENEVVVVAKLQHRNLVRLLGYCLEGEEKILVYEFVPNKSLDYFLFDSTMQSQLDWTRRYKIIGGIARGILYLHQDSRFTIIHRDLKAGNCCLRTVTPRSQRTVNLDND